MNLTINNSVTTINPQTVCDGGSYTIGASTYTSSGTYTDIFTAANGCDSIVTTILLVLPPLNISVTPTGPISFCLGSSVTLQSSTTNPNHTYVWSDLNGVISGASGMTYSVSSLSLIHI